MSKSIIVLAPLFVLTLITSILAGYKILKTSEEIKPSNEHLTISNNNGKAEAAPSSTTEKPEITKAVLTTSPTETDKPTKSTDNRCLITLQGQTYDVTSLRNTHPGGNIFVCGSDMTAAYQNQHGNNLAQMRAYLVTETTAGGGTNLSVNNNMNLNNRESEQQKRETEREMEDEDENEDN